MAAKGKTKAKARGKQTHRKTTASADSIFPPEIIFNILSRLPVKTLHRFKCVSKQWRTLVSLPKFISAHLTRSPASLIIHALKSPISIQEQPEPQPLRPIGHVIYAYGPPNPQSADPHHSTVDRILDFPGSTVVDFLEVIGSTPNGVVCISQHRFATKLTLWNPATRSSRSLPTPAIKPDPTLHRSVSVGLCFEPASCNDEIKVIRVISYVMDLRRTDAVEVFSLKSGRWKTLDEPTGNLRFWVHGKKCVAVIRGVPYWQGVSYDHKSGVRGMLLSFDAKRFAFDVDPFGFDVEEKGGLCIGEIREGCLGAVVWDRDLEKTENQVIDVWMRDAEGKWSMIYKLVGCLPVIGNVVGFYGGRGIVVEDGGEGNLSMFNLDNLEIEDFFNVEDALPSSFRVVSYRESLSRIPEMGNVIIQARFGAGDHKKSQNDRLKKRIGSK